MRPFVLLLASLLFAALPARAAVFTVGGDAACTHGSLLAAISAAAINGPALDEIRLANNIAYDSIIAPIARPSRRVGVRTMMASMVTPRARRMALSAMESAKRPPDSHRMPRRLSQSTARGHRR